MMRNNVGYSMIQTKEDVLKSVFGFDSFRENQGKIIDNIFDGKNVINNAYWCR